MLYPCQKIKKNLCSIPVVIITILPVYIGKKKENVGTAAVVEIFKAEIDSLCFIQLFVFFLLNEK